MRFLLLNDLASDLAVDQEQDAGNYGADSRDHCQWKTSEIYAYKHQAFQDQENSQQNPFYFFHVHFDLSFVLILNGIAIYRVEVPC